MIPLASPRAPAARPEAALYESHYLTATDPAGGRALWLRHTALKRPGAPARPTAWLTFFDLSAPVVTRALRVTAGDPLGHPGPAWWRCGLGEMGAAGARGAISDEARGAISDEAGAAGLRRASWELGWQPRAPELPYLPARWLYDRAVPRSNGVALVPAGTAHGRILLDGEQEIAVEGWEAMIGHNWGAEHADRWCWIHAGSLGADGRGWLDLVLVRIRIGPVLTPWIASGAVALDGQRFAPAPLRRVTCQRRGEVTTVRVALSPRAAVTLEVSAPRPATVTWDYASPRGPGRAVDNCSVADATVRLEGTGAPRSPALALVLNGTVAIEHGVTAAPSMRSRIREAPVIATH